jgi:hypothetical protein
MALTIWNVSWALEAAPLTRSGFCFVFSREDEPTPTECAKDPGQGPYLPILLAHEDLMESRRDDEDAVDISPFPTARPRLGQLCTVPGAPTFVGCTAPESGLGSVTGTGGRLGPGPSWSWPSS